MGEAAELRHDEVPPAWPLHSSGTVSDEKVKHGLRSCVLAVGCRYLPQGAEAEEGTPLLVCWELARELPQNEVDKSDSEPSQSETKLQRANERWAGRSALISTCCVRSWHLKMEQRIPWTPRLATAQPIQRSCGEVGRRECQKGHESPKRVEGRGRGVGSGRGDGVASLGCKGRCGEWEERL